MSWASATVRLVTPAIIPIDAVMVTGPPTPAPKAFASVPEPVLIVENAGFDEFHATVDVTSAVLL
jgi:hypothetical protein